MFHQKSQIAHYIPLNIHKIKNESLNDVNILNRA